MPFVFCMRVWPVNGKWNGMAVPLWSMSENQTGFVNVCRIPSDTVFVALLSPVTVLSLTGRLQDFHLRRTGDVRRGGGVDGTHDAGRDQQGGKCDSKANSQSFFDHDVLLSNINP